MSTRVRIRVPKKEQERKIETRITSEKKRIRVPKKEQERIIKTTIEDEDIIKPVKPKGAPKRKAPKKTMAKPKTVRIKVSKAEREKKLGKTWIKKYGSRAEVMHGNAKMTTGGLTKNDLMVNKRGVIVSKKKSQMAKKKDILSRLDK